MSKIKNGGLDKYGAGPFEQQQFGTAGVKGVKGSVKRCESFCHSAVGLVARLSSSTAGELFSLIVHDCKFAVGELLQKAQ